MVKKSNGACFVAFGILGCVEPGGPAVQDEVVGPARIPVQRCPEVDDSIEVQSDEPELCEWLNSIDVLAIGEVTALTASREFHSVTYSGVRDSAAALEALELSDRVPWAKSVLGNKASGRFQLVDSCPDGLSGSDEEWSLTVMEFPTLAVELKVVQPVKGVAGADELKFYIGRQQLQLMTGPKLTKASVEQDAELAPGTVVGVPLTQTEQGALVLGFQAPFEMDEQGEIVVQESCGPKMPSGLNGFTITALRAKIASCAADEAATVAGLELRAERLRQVSEPEQQPHFAAQCAFIVEGKRRDEG